MKAIILAGGIGVRLRPFTFSIPKPLLPIGEKPILQIIIERLKKFGFSEFVMAIGYKSKMVQTYFGDGSELGVCIHYLVEEKPSGTAGSLSQLREQFKFGKEESFLLMNGDILTKVNFGKMIEYHTKKNMEITVGVKNIREQKQYGVINIKNGMIQKITEKPFSTQAVSTGIYVIKSSVLNEIPPDTFLTMPSLINSLIAKKRSVGAYNIKEFWLGMEGMQHFENIYNNKDIRNKLITK